MTTSTKPMIAITMGDAAGIGPEITVKALQEEEIFSICHPSVIGSGAILDRTITLLKSPLQIHTVTTVTQTIGKAGNIDLLDLKNLSPADAFTGQISAACGRASMEYIARAAELALSGEVKAIVTAPINKEATKLAGYTDIGHLEYLARLTSTLEYATMLVSGTLRVVHLTTHYALKEACELVTKERILAKMKLTHDSLSRWGIGSVRIAIAGLNPHGGEEGLFGREEIEEISPAVKEARQLGIDAWGPYPADSIFNRAINGEFDVVLALYHDQGHIPIKVHGLEQSVSVALGLPFIRTSVDHGTAFNIAGKGIANEKSLVEAIKTAVRLIERSS